ncbi:MAG: InlB B-repeat-containing protein, partial [Eubacteriaceae bacterium]|nr:InlB B-repeat-containing protein [Eubacteriaceae bacterium]
GEPAGTAGYAYRLEAVEIQIVSKGNLPPETNPSNNTSLAFIQKESANIRTVHFDSQGADAIADQRLSIGTPISQPEDPVKDGYRFTGWFTDSSCITAWHFKDPVTQNMTLYAGWIEENTPDAGVSTHVENIGWMDFVQNGAIAGTSGRALRMEGLIFKSEGPVDLGISCSAHVQDYGWQHAVQEGMNAGTTGESKRLEAIKLTLSDFAAQNYDIYYRVHAQNIGWMAWTKNGKPAGTAGFAYRLEALQVRIVPKDGAVPDSNPPNAVSTPYLEK